MPAHDLSLHDALGRHSRWLKTSAQSLPDIMARVRQALDELEAASPLPEDLASAKSALKHNLERVTRAQTLIEQPLPAFDCAEDALGYADQLDAAIAPFAGWAVAPRLKAMAAKVRADAQELPSRTPANPLAGFDQAFASKVHGRRTTRRCPRCPGVLLVHARLGQYRLLCSEFPACRMSLPSTKASVKALVQGA